MVIVPFNAFKTIPKTRKISLSLLVKVNPFFPAGTEHHHPGGDISARSYKRYDF
jgi:hypothetical protein